VASVGVINVAISSTTYLCWYHYINRNLDNIFYNISLYFLMLLMCDWLARRGMLIWQNHFVEEGNPQIQSHLKSFSAALAKEIEVESSFSISVNTFLRWSVGQTTS